MRDLNEILTRNAKRFIEEAQASAAKEGRKLTEHMIAGRMAEAMGMKQDSVRKQLERLLHEGRDWTAPYIHGLAAALGKAPQEMVSLDPKAERVPEATIAEALYASLNHRLSLREVRAVIRRLHRQLDHRPMFDLCQALIDAMLEAGDKAAAYEAAHDLMKRAAAWDGNRRDLRGKKIVDHKS